jgi:hypothetical protein
LIPTMKSIKYGRDTSKNSSLSENTIFKKRRKSSILPKIKGAAS